MNSFIRTIITGFALFLTISVIAQPTLGLNNVSVASGSNVTMKVLVMDFTDINRYNGSINWDPTELEFVSLQNLDAIPELAFTLANFDVSDIANGKLTFKWGDGNSDMTIQDNNGLVEIFQIEFKALIEEGQTANVMYSDDPEPIVLNRTAAGNTNIHNPSFVQNGTVTTTAAIPDVFFDITTDSDIFCKGDQVCYDVIVSDFDSVIAMTIAVNWLGSVLEFDRAENFGLVRLNSGFNVRFDSIAQKRDSVARALWDAQTAEEFLAGGAFIEDGGTLLTLCFNIVGEPGAQSPIQITDSGNTTLELVHNDGYELDIIPNNALMEVTDCENLVIFSSDCMDGAPGDTVCVNFNAANFNDINAAKYNLTWDPSIIEFVKTDNYALPDLTDADFNANAGSLVFDWSSAGGVGVNLEDGSSLFSACYVIKGDVGATSFVNFLNLAGTYEVFNAAGEEVTDIRFRDCELNVIAPKVIVSTIDTTVGPNQPICMPVIMDDFLNIKHIEMPIEWDPAIISYVGLQNITLSGLEEEDFDLTGAATGSIQLVGWDSPDLAGITFNEPTELFSVCFVASGNIGDVSPFNFPNSLDEPVFIENIEGTPGVDVTNGSVTIASSGIIIASDEVTTEQATGFCVDITASNFLEVSSMQYTHAWDPTVLQFDSIGSIQLEGLTENDIVANSDSTIQVIWLSSDFANGTTVADNEVLYTLCFTPIGELGTSAGFGIMAPEVTTISSQGEDVGLFDNLGEIKVDNFGIQNVDITPPSCDGGDGVLYLEITGDEANYVYLIQKDGEAFADGDTPESIRLDNLSDGEYCVFVFASAANKNISECFSIGVLDNGTPIAIAGEDVDVGCDDLETLEIQLDGGDSQVPEGGIFSYNWSTLDGEIKPFDENKEMPIITNIGTYILTVINQSNNCSASDTVVVFNTPAPSVQIEPVEVLGCTQSTIQLDGESSEIRENNIHFWTTEGGNFVSDSTILKPTIDQEGTYILTVKDTLNGCTVTKSVVVFSDTVKPKAEAGNDRQLGCEDDFITLSGEGSSVGQGVGYEWSTPDGSSIVNPDKLDADVSRVGTYILTVTNEINGCQSNDTMMVLADESLPVARANNLAFIGCGMEEVMLDGSASSQGISFAYQWQDPNNQEISTEDMLIAQEAGQYILIVTNIDNDDCISDTAIVEVKLDQTPPVASITQSVQLSCKSDCLPITANVPDGDQYVYQWISEEGLVCENGDSPTAMVGSIGLYKFIITDTLNHCSDTSSTIVAADGTAIVADAGPAREIGCGDATTVTLDGQGSTVGDNITFSWTDEAGEVISTESTVDVVDAGQYTLTVEDSVEGCIATGKVSVTVNMEQPIANAGDDISIQGCEFPETLTLNGSGSDSGPQYKYAWNASNGGKIVGDTSLANPDISQAGTYDLTVTNINNGCTSTDQVLITSDLVIPVPNAGQDQDLSCNAPTISLSGLNEAPTTGTTILWTTNDGNIVGDPEVLGVEVDAPGTYTLTITSEDGCSEMDEVIIAANLEMPMADAGASKVIACNQQTFIDASGTTGENIEISWTTTNGNIIAGADSYNPEVNLGGLYQLTVTNLDNNCTATSEVIITAEDALPLADAGMDQEICVNEAVLAAIPTAENITGVWTTLEKSMVVSENEPTTIIADLGDGINTFVWTLSSENCPNYSSDTVTVSVPILPVAVDDAFEIAAGLTSGTIDLTANDQVNSEQFTVNITTPPTTGELTSTGNGVFEFNAPARYFGSQQFQYEVCSSTCSELCDVASARIVVLPGADVDTTNTLPNAITPNGDGMNDMLMFDELIFDATDFPQSELVIFNRWGDVIYKASPYNNDWTGRTDSGEELPEGTYYFVLRLDISEGEVMKGDITILR